MTNRLELNWKVDGFVDEQRYYCSETPIDLNNLPAPKAVLAGGVQTYIDTDIELGKTYFVRVGSVKNGIEKISEQISKLAGIEWIPSMIASNKLWLLANDYQAGSWSNKLSNTINFTNPTAVQQPTLVENTNVKSVNFNGSQFLTSTQTEAKNLARNTSKIWFSVVVKLKGIDASNTPSILSIMTPSGSSRFYLRYLQNSQTLGLAMRRLDSDSTIVRNVLSQNLNETKIIVGQLDYMAGTLNAWIDGVQISQQAIQSGGVTSDTAAGFSVGIGAWVTSISEAFLKAEIFDLQLGHAVIDTATRQKLEGWIAHNYALRENLTSDHPYKTLTPVI